MAKNTLQTEINKRKGKLNAFAVETQQKENQSLNGVIDYMADQAEYAKTFEVEGFTKEEVIQAAKFALKANPYDIDVRHLDVQDSPIYYRRNSKNKLKSRGRFKRKDLDDAGKALIAKARQVKIELEEKERQRVAKEADDILHASETMDVGMDINETQAAGAYESRDESAYESSNVVDDIMDNTDYAENMDKFFEGNLLTNKKGETVKDAARDNLMNVIDSALDKKIPSLSELKTILDNRIQQHMAGELVKLREEHNGNNETIIKELGPVKKQQVKSANELLLKYKEMYDAVQKGEMAPEVLKVFLNSAIMSNITDSESRMYDKLVTPKHVEKPSPEDDAKYRETLTELGVRSHGNPRYNIKIQYGGGYTLEPHEWIYYAKKKKIIPENVQPGGISEYVGVCVKNSSTFIHFSEDPAQGIVNYEQRKRIIRETAAQRETDKRIYITCKPNKEKELLQAWWKTLEAYPEIKKLHFKTGSGIYFDRQEKIVLYIPNKKNIEDIRPFLDAFSEECAKNDILADNANTMITAKKLMPGVGFAVEPKTKILNYKIDCGWMDQAEYKKMYKLVNPNSNSVINDCAYSYNMWVNKALILSCSIAKKKLGLKAQDKVSENKDKLVPLMKKYFADFMRIAGADPTTLDMLSDKNKEELK